MNRPCSYVRWMLIIITVIPFSACMRSLPDCFRLPAPDALPPIHVRGLDTVEVWPAMFARADAPPEEIERMTQWLHVEQHIAGRPLVAGNEVQVLIDGPMTFDVMFSAMRAAEHHIHLETFILSDDEIGQQLADILLERRRAGVEVRVIVDAFGALDAAEGFLNNLRAAGIEIHKYHPINPTEDLRFWRINTRHHRKMLIVDGRIGFLGGLNISGVYADSSFYDPDRKKAPDEAWRDTHVRVEGPIVADLQELFVALWAQLHASPQLSGPEYFPVLPMAGGDMIRAVNNMAADQAHEIYRLYLAGFYFAKRTIWITQGYFSPDRTFLEALKAASHRGVDVRLLLPGVTDSWITISSSRAHYEELLREGVRIFERHDVLQHAKTVVIDSLWSMVGSANLDHRSFLHANEANLVIWGREFGHKMDVLFLNDQAQNIEIKLSEWRERPLYRHLLETFASLFDYWL